jgi:hypothetical protein
MRRRAGLVVLATSVLAGVVVLLAHRQGLLGLLPAAAALLVLLSGRYPGDEALTAAALRRARPSRRRFAGTPCAPRRRPPRTERPRGGALVGLSLAGRAPPCAVS